MTIHVPQDKVDKALNLIDNMLKAKKVTLRTIQCLAGLLNFLTKVIKCGRVFLRRIYNLSKGLRFATQHVKVSYEARCDLRAWKFFLQKFNGSAIIAPINWNNPDFHIYSDASGFAFAVVFNNKWMQGIFPDEWSKKSIAIRELVPVFLAMVAWHMEFQNSTIVFHVDNQSVVNMLNSQTSPDPILLAMLRKIIVISMLHNIVFISQYIPGKMNIVSDHLSRLQVDKARQTQPGLEKEPEKILETWLPW